jgi:protocatechuate 3,4-dioxygenase beta subunit
MCGTDETMDNFQNRRAARARRRLLRFLVAGATGALLSRRAAIAQGFGREPPAAFLLTAAANSGAVCVADPMETAGPFPSDGTNRIGGSVSDVLLDSRIVRSDIRGSFGASNLRANGVPLRLTLRLLEARTSCRPLGNAAIYIWHCDSRGAYSLYADSLARVNYLRGVQVSGPDGEVVFQTVFPGCYFGRYPHIHIEVYPSLAATATRGGSILTTQLAMPRDVANAVYRGASDYSHSAENLLRITTQSDMVFADSSAAQIALQTPALAGSAQSDYTGRATIAIA